MKGPTSGAILMATLIRNHQLAVGERKCLKIKQFLTNTSFKMKEVSDRDLSHARLILREAHRILLRRLIYARTLTHRPLRRIVHHYHYGRRPQAVLVWCCW
jgi:hypothetical protein